MAILTTCTPHGERILTVVVTGLDADGETSDEIDMQSEMPNACLKYGYPRAVTMQAARTAGTTDVVEVNLLGSNITTVYAASTGGDDTTNVVSVVSTTQSDPVGETDLDPHRYYEVIVQTVGAGNTVTATAVFQWGP